MSTDTAFKIVEAEPTFTPRSTGREAKPNPLAGAVATAMENRMDDKGNGKAYEIAYNPAKKNDKGNPVEATRIVNLLRREALAQNVPIRIEILPKSVKFAVKTGERQKRKPRKTSK